MTDHTAGPRCGNNPNYRLTPGDRKAVDDFKARLALQADARPYIDSAVWVDGDPLMEVIAAAVWERCAQDDENMPQLVRDDPRTIAAFAAAVARAHAAVPSASVDRAGVLLWAADELDRYVGHQSSDAAPEVEGARLVIRELRRIAGQPSPVEAGKCGYYSPSGAYRCTQPAGHLGYHRHVRPDSDEWSSWVTGTAAPEQPAVGAQQPKEVDVSPTDALLASRCDACRHTLKRHTNHGACTVVLCVCGTFQPPANEQQPKEARP